MNYRMSWVASIIIVVGIVFLCGAGPLAPNPATYEVMRRCGPPMSITNINKETGESKNHFAIPVWYEYSTLLLDDETLRGFHFELADGTILSQ